MSLLHIVEFEDNDGEEIKLVKIRTPWASTEWTGRWSDDSELWDTVPEEVREEYHVEDNDGAFWMSFEDWVDEFEMCTICMMPTEE